MDGVISVIVEAARRVRNNLEKINDQELIGCVMHLMQLSDHPSLIDFSRLVREMT